MCGISLLRAVRGFKFIVSSSKTASFTSDHDMYNLAKRRRKWITKHYQRSNHAVCSKFTHELIFTITRANRDNLSLSIPVAN